MALDFTDGTGNLFNRQGQLANWIRLINIFQNTTAPDPLDDIIEQYMTSAQTEPDLVAALQAVRYTTALTSIGGINAVIRQLASDTVQRMVWRDNPLLSRSDPTTAIKEVIRQMVAQAASVQAATVALSAAVLGSVVGTGVVNLSTKRGDGLVNENMFASSTDRLVCTADSISGGATAGRETFQYQGAVGQSDPFHPEWPLGSGATATLTAIDATGNVSGGNLLTNSDFENYAVANTPDNWTIVAGAAGTDIKKQTGAFYTGSACLEFVGGGTAPNITQQFNNAGGTLGTVSPQTPYGLSFWMRAATVPAAGVITFDLIDGSNTVLQDAQGSNQTFAVTCSGLSGTTFGNFKAAFRLGINPGTTVKLRIRASTGISSGSSIYLDHLAFGPLTRLYIGGPFCGVFSGATAYQLNDTYTITTTNNRGGASNLALFQSWFDRAFGMRQLDLLLPSSGSPTVSDGLIS